jgi:hypothetical protein
MRHQISSGRRELQAIFPVNLFPENGIPDIP